MSITRTDITTLLQRLGPARVYVGNPLTNGGMASLGTVLEGDRRGEIEFEENALTLPEVTAAIPHDVLMNVSAARVVVPVLLNGEGATIWTKISPFGTSGFGFGSFRRPVTTGVLLIPEAELGKSLDWSTVNSRWERTNDDDTIDTTATAAPRHALWLWKARARFGPLSFPFADGGKTVVEVTFEAQYDETKPDGARVAYIGNPRAFTTPILVDL